MTHPLIAGALSQSQQARSWSQGESYVRNGAVRIGSQEPHEFRQRDRMNLVLPSRVGIKASDWRIIVQLEGQVKRNLCDQWIAQLTFSRIGARPHDRRNTQDAGQTADTPTCGIA